MTTSRSKTSDLEREAVLWQNDIVRRKFAANSPGSFQKLRRCCICLRNRCKDQAKCRAEFTAWAERKWDAAVAEVAAARSKAFNDHRLTG